MKIKRFEAKSMSEALRMIKKEFGEEAVILSAKNAKKSGKLFNSKGNRQVIVTAAIDMAPAKSDFKNQTIFGSNGMAEASQLNGSVELDQDRGASILERFQPITKTGRNKLQPKLVRLMSGQQPSSAYMPAQADDLYEKILARGLSSSIARDLADQVAQLLSMVENDHIAPEDALAQVIAAKGWVAPGLSAPPQNGRHVVLVGSHGVGKTAAAAKLAASCLLNGIGTPAVISIDNQRVGATLELERLTRIMGIPLYVAEDHHHLARICREIGSNRIMIIDTPGISPSDSTTLDAVDRMLKFIKDPQIHLTINASFQEKLIKKTIAFFRPLGVNRLLLTQLDMIEDIGHVINQMEASSLPTTYLSNNAQVADGLLRATPVNLSRLLLNGRIDHEQSLDEMPVTLVSKKRVTSTVKKYAANCNSDIFHDVSCKSVARMKKDHILVFTDALDAKAQGFKPCRTCCAELQSLKPYDHLDQTHQTPRQQVL